MSLRVDTMDSRQFHVALPQRCDPFASGSDFAWHAPVVSKAFTKDDGAEDPPFVAPRAPLPAGAPNYVTPRGLALLV